MDEERIQTHGIAAGGVVYHLIPGLHGWTVLDFKKTVILHTGEAGDPLAFYYGPFFRLIHINHMVGINMSGDKRVQVCTAAVSDEEGMVTDFLHIFYRGDECRSPGDQGYAGFSDQRGTRGIEFSAQLLTDGVKIIPVIRLVLPPRNNRLPYPHRKAPDYIPPLSLRPYWPARHRRIQCGTGWRNAGADRRL